MTFWDFFFQVDTPRVLSEDFVVLDEPVEITPLSGGMVFLVFALAITPWNSSGQRSLFALAIPKSWELRGDTWSVMILNRPFNRADSPDDLKEFWRTSPQTLHASWARSCFARNPKGLITIGALLERSAKD
jgi:hypothetical protein